VTAGHGVDLVAAESEVIDMVADLARKAQERRVDLVLFADGLQLGLALRRCCRLVVGGSGAWCKSRHGEFLPLSDVLDWLQRERHGVRALDLS
jgi:hypothetical protein